MKVLFFCLHLKVNTVRELKKHGKTYENIRFIYT